MIQEGIRKNLNFLVLFLLVFGILSCSETSYFQETQNLKGTWKSSEKLEFNFEITDTTSLYNLYINFINNNNYPYSNVYMFSKFAKSNELISTDTTEFYLAYSNGDWIANKSGSSYQRKLWLKRNLKLNEIGTYQISLRHGMRDYELIGVEEIGIVLEKTQQNENNQQEQR